MVSDDPKYIIIDNGMIIYPIVFPNFIEHTVIATAMAPAEVLGAGFVSIGPDGHCVAHGESRSLRLKAEEGDTAMLTKMLTLIGKY